MNSKTITKGFVIAGLMNMSVLVFSRFFSNPVIPEFDPVVMSNFGLLMIVIWGLAYISVAKYYQHTKWLIGVFAVEKLIYGFNWSTWILSNDLSNIYDKDLFAGLFFSVYGINDWLFFLFFSYVFIQIFRSKK